LTLGDTFSLPLSLAVLMRGMADDDRTSDIVYNNRALNHSRTLYCTATVSYTAVVLLHHHFLALDIDCGMQFFYLNIFWVHTQDGPSLKVLSNQRYQVLCLPLRLWALSPFFIFCYLNIFWVHTQDGPYHKVLSHQRYRYVFPWSLAILRYSQECRWFDCGLGLFKLTADEMPLQYES